MAGLGNSRQSTIHVDCLVQTKVVLCADLHGRLQGKEGVGHVSVALFPFAYGSYFTSDSANYQK
jgi:hypothetical protein